MAIVIDGEITVLPISPTLRELIARLNELHEAGRYEHQIMLNGSEQTLETLKNHQHLLSHEDRIEIVTCSLDELVEDTLHTSMDVQPQFYKALETSAKCFRVGDVGAGSSQFRDVIDLFHWQVEVLNNLTALHPGPSAIHELFDELRNRIPPLLEAWGNEDFIFLADQIEYEILPWIERWYSFLQMFEQQMSLEKMKVNLGETPSGS